MTTMTQKEMLDDTKLGNAVINVLEKVSDNIQKREEILKGLLNTLESAPRPISKEIAAEMRNVTKNVKESLFELQSFIKPLAIADEQAPGYIGEIEKIIPDKIKFKDMHYKMDALTIKCDLIDATILVREQDD